MADQIALLIGASPKNSRGGPVTRIPPGRWLIHIYPLVDSAFRLIVDGLVLDVWHGAELTLHKHSDVQLAFLTRGNESHLDAFVVRN